MSSHSNNHDQDSLFNDVEQESQNLNAPISPMDYRNSPVPPGEPSIPAILPEPLVVEELHKPMPVLQNIVSTIEMGVRLDLKKIALQAKNTEYKPHRFCALIMRICEPKTTALIFQTGKMTITGGRTVANNKIAARKFARIVQKLGYPVMFTNYTVQNLVASCDVKFPINLTALGLLHEQFTFYEPEIFPGLIYRMVQPRVSLSIFRTGKLTITGAKTENQFDEAFDQIYPVLKMCKT